MSISTSTKWKDVTIEGSVFPDARVRTDLKTKLSKEIESEYIPALNEVMENEAYGFRLLVTIMAQKEGFFKGSRSYRTNNPGNIGNTDTGQNKPIANLKEGILAQRNYLLKIVEGKHRAYPMGKLVVLKPYYSPEIARNPQYGLPAYLPGYRFTFTGQLDQFVKIYATGARAGNGYLSMIVSWFHSKGFTQVTAQSKIQDLIELEQ